MELEVLKLVGAGLATIGAIGAAFGVGMIFSSFNNAIARNPSVESKIRPMTFVGAALAEAIGIFAIVVAIILIFVA